MVALQHLDRLRGFRRWLAWQRWQSRATPRLLAIAAATRRVRQPRRPLPPPRPFVRALQQAGDMLSLVLLVALRAFVLFLLVRGAWAILQGLLS